VTGEPVSDSPLPLVGGAAREYVVAADTPVGAFDAPLWQRSRALRALTAEADSFSRLGAGLLAWLVGVGATACLGAAFWHGAPAVVRVPAAVGAVLLAYAAARIGRTTWLSGRAVVDAYSWWTLLPERVPGGGAGVEDWRARPVRDAVQARVWVFQGWRPLRIGLAALAFLSPFAFLALGVEGGPRYQPTWDEGQGTTVLVVTLGLLVTGWVAGATVLWGQFRMSRAHAERDPIQRWILRRDR
jgi:hypothetical protein